MVDRMQELVLTLYQWSSSVIFLLLFVGELMSLVGLADDASVVDLTSRHVTVNTLTEARINCTTEQKVVMECIL